MALCEGVFDGEYGSYSFDSPSVFKYAMKCIDTAKGDVWLAMVNVFAKLLEKDLSLVRFHFLNCVYDFLLSVSDCDFTADYSGEDCW